MERKRSAHESGDEGAKRIKSKMSSPLKLTSVMTTKIEYAVTQLQQSIREILAESPNLKQLRKALKHVHEQSDSKEVLITATRNQKLYLAATLKSLYEEGDLKLFEQIVAFDEHTKLKGTGNSKLRIKKDKYECNNDDHIVPGIPPLPKINDPTIEATVFTHKSAVGNTKYLSKTELLNSNNERLEFLGDSVINSLVTQLLFQMYPNYNEGKLSILRAQIVNNNSLGEFSRMYGFPDKLLVNFAKDAAFSQGKHKLYSDVFEAYVGGLYVDSGYNNLDEIKHWLYLLIRPRLSGLTGSLYEDSVDLNSKGKLYSLIGSAANPPKYVTTRVGNGLDVSFMVDCMMGDEVIGTGEGHNQKEAGLYAAENALGKHDVIEKYMKLREETPREVSVVATKIPETTRKQEPLPEINPQDEQLVLPVRVEASDVNVNSSDKLYSLLSKNKILPVYKTTGKGTQFTTMLTINDVDICSSVGTSKKKSRNQCANFVLEHLGVLNQCHAFLD